MWKIKGIELDEKTKRAAKNILLPYVVGQILFIVAALIGGFCLEHAWGTLLLYVFAASGFAFIVLGTSQLVRLTRKSSS